MSTFRTAELDMAKNDEALQINFKLLEEKREQAAITEAKSKIQMEKYYNAKVRNTSFKPGDLVYRNNEASRAEDTGKLTQVGRPIRSHRSTWEGIVQAKRPQRKGASADMECQQLKEVLRTQNVSNLPMRTSQWG
ncbi:hypothetical protein Tco_0301003 [Tanacetum coccineum]